MADDEPLDENPQKARKGLLSVFASKRDKPPKQRVLKSRGECKAERAAAANTEAGRCQAKATIEPPKTEPQPSQPFKCPLCGASVVEGARECADCGSRLVTGVSDSQLDELEEAERHADDEPPQDSSEGLGGVEPPGVRFDAETGTVSRLPEDEPPECSNCGTEIEFEAEVCPMCGARMAKEVGIVDLFKDMAFDSDESPEMDCPFCGEHVVLDEGVCPKCQEKVQSIEDEIGMERVDPVIHMDNVVFLHLDVSAGEVNLLHRQARNRGLEQITLQLEGTERSEDEGNGKTVNKRTGD